MEQGCVKVVRRDTPPQLVALSCDDRPEAGDVRREDMFSKSINKAAVVAIAFSTVGAVFPNVPDVVDAVPKGIDSCRQIVEVSADESLEALEVAVPDVVIKFAKE